MADQDWLIVSLLPDEPIPPIPMRTWELPEQIKPEYPDSLEHLFENFTVDINQLIKDVKTIVPILEVKIFTHWKCRDTLRYTIDFIKKGDFERQMQPNMGFPIIVIRCLDKMGEYMEFLSMKIRYLKFRDEGDWSGLVIDKSNKSRILYKCRIILYQLYFDMKTQRSSNNMNIIRELYNFTISKCSTKNHIEYFANLYNKLILSKRKSAHKYVLDISILSCSIKILGNIMPSYILYFILEWLLVDTSTNLYILSGFEQINIIESVQNKYRKMKHIETHIN